MHVKLRDDYIEKISIKPNYMVIYNEYVGNRARIPHHSSLENLKVNKQDGELSHKAIKRLYNTMDWFLIIAKNKQCENLKSGSYFTYKLSMLTLTLPCEQLHDDLYVKKKMLNEFLTILRKKYQLQNYIWKAEKQKNGNIHFHIVVDRYIYYKEINRIWNKILDFHGYIEKYRSNQKEIHKNGFRLNKRLSESWSKMNQLKAYKMGVAQDWRNPNGTTDIHSLKKIRNAKAYLGKYLTKNPDYTKSINEEIQKYCEKYNYSDISAVEYDEIKQKVKNKMTITGNLWYISQSLSKLKGAIYELSNDIREDLDRIRIYMKEKIKYLDFCAVYKLNINELIKLKLNNLVNCFKKYIFSVREIFYPPGTQEYYSLGIPLPIFDN